MITCICIKEGKFLENQEKVQSKFKRRIIVIALSMLLCMLLIGVSVWAATSQSLTSPNTILITTDGQAKVGITASYAFGADDETLFSAIGDQDATVTGLSYTQIAQKTADNNSVSQKGPDIVFSADGEYTYVAYKIDFANTEASAVNYTIEFTDPDASNGPYTFDGQVSIYSAAGTDSFTFAQDQTAMSRNLAKSASTTVYVIVALNTAPDSLTAADLDNFNLVVTATVSA